MSGDSVLTYTAELCFPFLEPACRPVVLPFASLSNHRLRIVIRANKRRFNLSLRQAIRLTPDFLELTPQSILASLKYLPTINLLPNFLSHLKSFSLFPFKAASHCIASLGQSLYSNCLFYLLTYSFCNLFSHEDHGRPTPQLPRIFYFCFIAQNAINFYPPTWQRDMGDPLFRHPSPTSSPHGPLLPPKTPTPTPEIHIQSSLWNSALQNALEFCQSD